MWTAIGAIFQILYLVLKNKFEKDDVEKTRKQEMYEKAKTAIASRDASRINGILDELRESS